MSGDAHHAPPMLTRSLRAQSASDWIWIRCALWLLWPGLFTGCTNFYGKGIQYQIEHTYGVTDPQFMRSMGSLVEPGILASNKVTTLLNGDEIFPAMLEAVRTARKSICLETYIYWSGSVGREFADALAERARAGVKVHVIIDWIGSRRIDSELLAQVYLELVGGRQARLQLAPGDGRSAGIGFVRIARSRPNPLPSRLLPEEREAHARFITGDVEGDVIWNWAA